MDTLSFVMSTIALCLYSLSYFFNNKRNYLILQLSGNVFLSLSFLFIEKYFTMIALAIGIARGIICYVYERKDRKVPVYLIIGLCVATILCYVIINLVILREQASPWDILYLFASCMYAVTFAVRNIRAMRFLVLIPHTSAVAYNLIVHAPISSAISYGIELAVTLVAIVKFEIEARKKCK